MKCFREQYITRRQKSMSQTIQQLREVMKKQSKSPQSKYKGVISLGTVEDDHSLTKIFCLTQSKDQRQQPRSSLPNNFPLSRCSFDLIDSTPSTRIGSCVSKKPDLLKFASQKGQQNLNQAKLDKKQVPYYKQHLNEFGQSLKEFLKTSSQSLAIRKAEYQEYFIREQPQSKKLSLAGIEKEQQSFSSIIFPVESHKSFCSRLLSQQESLRQSPKSEYQYSMEKLKSLAKQNKNQTKQTFQTLSNDDDETAIKTPRAFSDKFKKLCSQRLLRSDQYIQSCHNLSTQESLSSRCKNGSQKYFVDEALQTTINVSSECVSYRKFIEKLFNQMKRQNFQKNPLKGKQLKLQPYQPQLKYKKTIVFDLDETLIHCREGLARSPDKYVKVSIKQQSFDLPVYFRPKVFQLINQLSKVCELALYTASHPAYVESILKQMSLKDKFQIIAYKEHCLVNKDGILMKDLRIFGRDLKDIVLIDDTFSAMQVNNFIPILPFEGDQMDNQLTNLLAFLIYQLLPADDVQKVLQNHFELQKWPYYSNVDDVLQNLYCL